MSEVKLHNIFPTSIFQSNIGVDKKIKRQLINEAYDFIYQKDIKNGSVTVNKFILNKDNYKSLAKKILDKLSFVIFESYQVDRKLKFYITNSWCIKHEKGDIAELHHHTNCIFSGVYYFQTPKNSGDIIFKSKDNIFSSTLSIPTDQNLREHKIKVEEGTLLLFPSHLPHCTEVSKSNKHRYSLAFNVFFSGEIGSNVGLNKLII
jgi:uncharacterized protein (TIGR02466 family)